MIDDESVLDVLGIIAFTIAIASATAMVMNGRPPIRIVESISPLLLGGIAAVAGAGSLLAFFKSRQ